MIVGAGAAGAVIAGAGLGGVVWAAGGCPLESQAVVTSKNAAFTRYPPFRTHSGSKPSVRRGCAAQTACAFYTPDLSTNQQSGAPARERTKVLGSAIVFRLPDPPGLSILTRKPRAPHFPFLPIFFR